MIFEWCKRRVKRRLHWEIFFVLSNSYLYLNKFWMKLVYSNTQKHGINGYLRKGRQILCFGKAVKSIIFERSSAKQIFTQKSNIGQTERLMLLLEAFNRRSIENPSANRQIIFEKCSFRRDQHPWPGFPVLRSNSHAVCSIMIGCIL